MAEKPVGKEQDPRIVYADIIDLPHWQSPTRQHMSLYDRAAQFSPFAALTGFDDMVAEEARIVDERIELSENALEQLRLKLDLISDAAARGEMPVVTITSFVPDPFKHGGAYTTVTEKVKKVDHIAGSIILDRKDQSSGKNMEIKMTDILEIGGKTIDSMFPDR